MKTNITLLITLICFVARSQAQITITRADMPCPSAASCGQDSVIYTSVPVANNTIDVVPTGASSIWNILPLQNGTAMYQNFLPVSQTPAIFQLTFFGSDYAQPLIGNNAVAGLPVTDAYEYYNYAGADSRLEIKGFGAYITIPGQGSPVPLPAIYSSPDVLYRFPMNFGDMDSSVSGFSVDVPPVSPIATIKRDQKRVNHVDGWGSVTTPAGTFDVLRIKSDITRVDSVVGGPFPFGAPTNPIEYKWLGAAKKIPVLQVTGNNAAAVFTPVAITFWGGDPLAAPEHIRLNNELQLYPNPAVQQVSVQFSLQSSSDVAIEIYSIFGKKVASFNFDKLSAGKHLEYLPVHLLSSGTYIIKCSTAQQSIASKLIKL